MQKLIDGELHTRETIVEQYANLVYKHANQLSQTDKMIKEDLIQEGFYGLILAFDRYDVDSKNKFITIAYKYVRGWMLNYKRSQNTFSGVSEARAAALKIKSAQLWETEDAEIVEKLDMSPGLVERARLFVYRKDTVSVDSRNEEDGDIYYRLGYQQDFSETDVNFYLEDLTSREQTITLRLMQEHTAADIGAGIGITGARVGQIAKVIRRKLEGVMG